MLHPIQRHLNVSCTKTKLPVAVTPHYFTINQFGGAKWHTVALYLASAPCGQSGDFWLEPHINLFSFLELGETESVGTAAASGPVVWWVNE